MNKTFRLIKEERDKQIRLRVKGLEVEDGVAYVDTARNISVVLESGDLSEDFQELGLESGNKYDKLAPNSKMFHRLAKYYANKKETNLAMNALEDAQRLVTDAKEKDFSIQETEARLHLDTGKYEKALKCAEKVLWQPNYKNSLMAIYVKSQALFNLCDFEHSLMAFHKGNCDHSYSILKDNCRQKTLPSF